MTRLSTSSLVRQARAARIHRPDAGLTLVEIMVVIAILGLLMTVVAVNVMGSLNEGYVETTKLQMTKIEQGLQMYAVKHRTKYPSSSEGLEAAAKYFPDNQVPLDAWGNEFIYNSPSSNSDAPYELISLGADGQEGGEDYDADIKSWELSGSSD